MEWYLPPMVVPGKEFALRVVSHSPKELTEVGSRYLAQILWQRGIRDDRALAEFLDPHANYTATSAWEFGEEMVLACDRLVAAYDRGEKVAIWGDFDADGITATSVLWEGLGAFFPQSERLFYYIPNRITESHGLKEAGIDRLFAEYGVNVIVTCDTGSTDVAAIVHAKSLGIDTIVTDHHTLLPDRPPVAAIINPRNLPASHPLHHLSGVAVAYKLVEAMYSRLPKVPTAPVENLLDLVAIGLVADLVELKGDCRYLARLGIDKLSELVEGNGKKGTFSSRRPGISAILSACKKSGTRAMDISFGIAPRINAISRIYGDTRFAIDLLTSRDALLCRKLAQETELVNTRRKGIQKEVVKQAKKRLEKIDLSTTETIVLLDDNWPIGVLGLVAGEIAREYGKPTILLTTSPEGNIDEDGHRNIEANEIVKDAIARGSARSANNIDLYQLIHSQSHLLLGFGGHPFAAGLSLLADNISLFAEGIDRTLRTSIDPHKTGIGRQEMADIETFCHPPDGKIVPDATITLVELGREIFDAIYLLEPYGMGNPPPKFLINNCHFPCKFTKSIEDIKGKKVGYTLAEFTIADRSLPGGIKGTWWSHNADEIPAGNCDAIVELDYNSYEKKYQVRAIDIRPAVLISANTNPKIDRVINTDSQTHLQSLLILDYRHSNTLEDDREDLLFDTTIDDRHIYYLQRCPRSWNDLTTAYHYATTNHQTLALCYHPQTLPTATTAFSQLIGIAKYLAKTDATVSLEKISRQLNLHPTTIDIGLLILEEAGFIVSRQKMPAKVAIAIPGNPEINPHHREFQNRYRRFEKAIAAERFQQDYFMKVPLYTIQTIIDLHQLTIEG
jgi:single-stranded-DNA-specific exonuclease